MYICSLKMSIHFFFKLNIIIAFFIHFEQFTEVNLKMIFCFLNNTLNVYLVLGFLSSFSICILFFSNNCDFTN